MGPLESGQGGATVVASASVPSFPAAAATSTCPRPLSAAAVAAAAKDAPSTPTKPCPLGGAGAGVVAAAAAPADPTSPASSQQLRTGEGEGGGVGVPVAGGGGGGGGGVDSRGPQAAAVAAAAGGGESSAMVTDEGRGALGPGLGQAVQPRGAPLRPRKIYGRLPKFSPFLGTFQHAPSAGNRSRAVFFEQHLMSEEEHERRKRIRTNPFTGTFHYFPGRYSALHGLQRFRGQAAFLHSFDELDRLAALGRRVSQRVRQADNPAQAASFLHGVFATPAAAAATPQTRRSQYPHKTKEGAALYAELTLTGVLPRYRYGGAVDTSRRFGSSLDDGCLTVHPASALYADILYRWNGFRLHHVKRVRPLLLAAQQQHMFKRHGSVYIEMGMGGPDGSFGFGPAPAAGGRARKMVHSTSMHVPHGSMMARTSSVPTNMDLSSSSSSSSVPGPTPMQVDGQHGNGNGNGYRSLKGRSPSRGGLDVLGGGGGSSIVGSGDYHLDPDEIPGSSSGSSGDEEGSAGGGPVLARSRQQSPQQPPQQGRRRMTPPLPPRGGVGRVATAPARPGGDFGGAFGRQLPAGGGRPPRGAGGVAFARAGASGGASGGSGGEKEKVKVGDKYDVNHAEVLGEGSYAAVYGATGKASGEAVAVKAIKRRYLFSEEEKASVRSEVENMRRLPRHRNIIGLLETFETAEHVYLVMERSTHGNLEQMLQLRRKLTELETMWVIKQLLDAVAAMHGAGVLHCDIKPHNLLFSDAEGGGTGAQGGANGGTRLWMYTSPLGMVLKVCDFGLSRKVPDARYYKHTGDIYRVPFSRMVGTCGFIPPEIIRKQAYGKPADMWSVGVVCYKMLTGSLPFIPPTKCLEQPVGFRGRIWDTISKDAQDFMAALLRIDQNKRATVREALGHRWLQTVPEWGPDLACSASTCSSSSGGGGQGSPLMRSKTICVADTRGLVGDEECRGAASAGGGGGSGPQTRESEDSDWNESRSVW